MTLLDYYHPFAGTDSLEIDWHNIFRHLNTSGPLRGELNRLAVSADGVSGRVTKIATGDACMRGFYGLNSSIKTMTHTANASGNPRIDLVIVRVDFANNRIEFAVLAGTPAGSPVAPALTQDTTGVGVYEVALAQVAIANGYTNVAAVDVTDRRPWSVQRHGAGGVIGSFTSTADVAVATATNATHVDFTGYTFTFEAHAGRRYRVSFFGTLVGANNPNGTGMLLEFREAAAVLASSQSVVAGSTLAPAKQPMLVEVIVEAPTAGQHTYKLSLYVATGVATSTVKILGSASADAGVTKPLFTVTDIGPSL